MNKDEVIEAYYFCSNKEAELSKLFENFPHCFSESKLTPLNFQLHMNLEAEEQGSQRSSSANLSNRDKLSAQSNLTRQDLKKSLLNDILVNKANHPVFCS